MLVFVAFVQLVCVSASVTQMSLVREWDSVDVLVPRDGGQGTSRFHLSLYDETYSDDIYIWLLDVYKDRLFVGLRPTTAPFYLAYHNLSDTSKSLLLQPYPSWDAHSDEHGDRQIHDVVALRADRCDRLWVIDKVDYVDENRIIVFDLNTDRILRKYTFSHSIDLLYHNMAVDDDDCKNPYLYISDRRQGGIWTYSWAEDTMWHHPGGIVTWMVLAPNIKSDYSTIYFNKDKITRVWYISTRYLRDKTSNLSEFEHREGYDFYLVSTALDAKSNVLFVHTFDKPDLIGAYPCWNRYEWCGPSVRHDIAVNTTHEVIQIILDKNGNLWALTRRAPFEDNQINLSIFLVAIPSANVELNNNDTTNTTELNETTSPATDPASDTSVQARVVYNGISYNTGDIEETPAVTPNNTITATDPIASNSNSDIATQAIGNNKMTHFANILFNFTNNTFILSNFTISYSPSNNVK